MMSANSFANSPSKVDAGRHPSQPTLLRREASSCATSEIRHALVFRARERKWEVIHGETQVVENDPDNNDPDDIDGVYSEGEYRHIKTKLELDDTIVLYGNGFARSAFPTGGVVGHTRLLETLQDAPHTQPESRLAHLIGLIQGSGVTEEDSTIMVCRVTNVGVRLRDNLLAPLRLFKRPADSTALA